MPDHLRAPLAIIVILFLGWLLSSNRRAIVWRSVGWGLALQVILAVLVLKTGPGQAAMNLANRVITALVETAEVGAEFVFGENYAEHWVAFAVPSTIIFFSALMAVLYHLGVLQWVVRLMALVVVRVLPVSGAEALAACANVFIGNTESPLMIKPYLKRMTEAELTTVMLSGFATISGGMMAVYVGFGAQAGYLLTASLMAAPASLMMAKILCPETGQPETRAGQRVAMERTEVNVFGALCSGAATGARLAINVLAMLIAFISLAALLNMLLGLLPPISGTPLTVERILGWAFSPLAWLIGAEGRDALAVGQLLGVKLFLGEFLAYLQLGDMAGELSDKSYAIATFALCGFGNFVAVGIQIGGIGSLVESRRDDLARLGLRAMLGGTLVTLMTATIAGVLL
ncbi:MAG: NupC/NupG family nucleoside CNT transporter [Xanthomonadales bacterium]|nr:NupC/NupG family nucleoside CNT transporter [Xanthomonadales bacterium]